MGNMAGVGHKVDLADHGKRDIRAQFAALPWRRRNGRIDVLLVTTRDTGRWVIPKGWPMNGRTPAETAAIEAREEAGVVGIAGERCLGIFTYLKVDKGTSLPVIAAVFPLEVTRMMSDWDEKALRKRKWVPIRKAAKMVSDPELATLLLDPTLPKLLN